MLVTLLTSIEMSPSLTCYTGLDSLLEPRTVVVVALRLLFGLFLRWKWENQDANQMAVGMAGDALCLELPWVWPMPEHPILLPQKIRSF